MTRPLTYVVVGAGASPALAVTDAAATGAGAGIQAGAQARRLALAAEPPVAGRPRVRRVGLVHLPTGRGTLRGCGNGGVGRHRYRDRGTYQGMLGTVVTVVPEQGYRSKGPGCCRYRSTGVQEFRSGGPEFCRYKSAGAGIQSRGSLVLSLQECRSRDPGQEWSRGAVGTDGMVTGMQDRDRPEVGRTQTDMMGQAVNILECCFSGWRMMWRWGDRAHPICRHPSASTAQFPIYLLPV